MKLARILQTSDLRQRAAAIRYNVARRIRPAAAPVLPRPADVAGAIELEALTVPELNALHDTAALIAEICCAVSCQPRCLTKAADGSEEPTAAGRLAVWQMGLGTSLMDRVIDRLEELGQPARRDGSEPQMVDVLDVYEVAPLRI
ncbi:hypothetical protein ABC766_12885 [Methylobacterium fujisawaense]|uniref:hypothetical protein n=1 Tax=Methylobacterium fujisawaense TaxID=107400 RepID=UPI0031F4BB3D